MPLFKRQPKGPFASVPGHCVVVNNPAGPVRIIASGTDELMIANVEHGQSEQLDWRAEHGTLLIGGLRNPDADRFADTRLGRLGNDALSGLDPKRGPAVTLEVPSGTTATITTETSAPISIEGTLGGIQLSTLSAEVRLARVVTDVPCVIRGGKGCDISIDYLECPRLELDLDVLGSFTVMGGSIDSVAVRTAGGVLAHAAVRELQAHLLYHGELTFTQVGTAAATYLDKSDAVIKPFALAPRADQAVRLTYDLLNHVAQVYQS